jgi:hypothetical protein
MGGRTICMWTRAFNKLRQAMTLRTWTSLICTLPVPPCLTVKFQRHVPEGNKSCVWWRNLGARNIGSGNTVPCKAYASLQQWVHLVAKQVLGLVLDHSYTLTAQTLHDELQVHSLLCSRRPHSVCHYCMQPAESDIHSAEGPGAAYACEHQTMPSVFYQQRRVAADGPLQSDL